MVIQNQNKINQKNKNYKNMVAIFTFMVYHYEYIYIFHEILQLFL